MTPPHASDPKSDTPGRQTASAEPHRPSGSAPGAFALAPDTRDGREVLDIHTPILDELSEPRDGYEPIPFWLISAIAALVFWGGYYMANHGGGFRADIYTDDPAALYADRFAGPPPTPLSPVELGRLVFTANCAACHLPTGLGQPGQYPPLVGSEWVSGPPERLHRIVLHGLKGPITVAGQMYNNQMPPFGQRLSDTQIAAVLTYVRQAWTNTAGPVSPDEVAATRTTTRDRSDPWTAPELLAVSANPSAANPPSPTRPTP